MFQMNFTPFEPINFNSLAIYSFRDTPIPKDFYPQLPYYFRTLLFRNQINMNTFVLEVGNPRTSKSYLALKTGEIYMGLQGKKFDVEKQLAFDDIKGFLKWSQKEQGSFFILDETGTTLSPDQFWSLQQHIMRNFIQTQGFRKNVLVWILPSIVFLQKGFRFMANYGINTIRQGVAEVYKIVVDQLRGKGFPDRIETLRYSLPSEETIEKYERMKKEWNDEALKKEIAFLEEIENPEKTKIITGCNLGEIYHKQKF